MRGCIPCYAFGVVIPWALLLFGAFVGLFPQAGPDVDRLAAYFMLAALLMLVGSILMHRFPPKRH